MDGRKSLFTFIVLLIFIFTFSYFRNVTKRDKQLKLQRELKMKNELEQRKLREKLREEKLLKEIENHQKFLDSMKEYKNICNSIHVFISKPEETIIVEYLEQSDNNEQIENEKCENSENNNNNNVKKDALTAEEILHKTRQNVLEPIIYLFLLVLTYSLIKAAMEISRHFNKKKEEELEQQADRRRSLQEYAAAAANAPAKNELRNPKAPLLRRSTVFGTNMQQKYSNFIETGRINDIIPEVINPGTQIELPGSPARHSNTIGCRPPPLLRRSSVPAFAFQNLGHNIIRRPSMDSFSEDDSSPDMKRRVRMIHRH